MAFSVVDLETETPILQWKKVNQVYQTGNSKFTIPDYDRYMQIYIAETVNNGNHALPDYKPLCSHKCSQDELSTTFENVHFKVK